jgi:hypothetical protein
MVASPRSSADRRRFRRNFGDATGAGVYRSKNPGSSWTAVNAGLSATNIRAIEAKGGTLFAGGQIGTSVVRSTDLGASWTLLRGGLPTSSYRGFASDSPRMAA